MLCYQYCIILPFRLDVTFGCLMCGHPTKVTISNQSSIWAISQYISSALLELWPSVLQEQTALALVFVLGIALAFVLEISLDLEISLALALALALAFGETFHLS